MMISALAQWKFYIVVWILMTVSVAPAEAWKSDVAKEFKDIFNEELRAVRPENMLLPMTYLEVEGETYGYALPRRFAVLATSGDRFKIRKIKSKDNYIIVELESDREARLKIYLFDVKKRVTRKLAEVVFPMMLKDVFEFGEAPLFARVVANTSSNLAHVGACNHLPPEEEREAFADLEAAENAGFRPCPACFSPDPALPIPNYMPIRTAALEEARLFERAFPPVEDQALQDKVQDLGERLLGDFPVPPKGFPYRFRVVESEVMMGISYPTGFVYVTDKLVGAVEDEIELAHVLAHEITHCELHLPPNQQISQPTGLDPILLETAWKNYYRTMRWRETAADFLAINAVGALYTGSDPAKGARSILSKLQFANEAFPMHEGGFYDTHPTYGSRLLALKGGFFPVDGDQFFEARDKDDAWVCRLKVLGGGWQETGQCQIHILVEMAPGTMDGLKISTQSVDYEFGSAGGGKMGEIIFPDGTDFDLKSESHETIAPGQFKTLVLVVKGAEKKEYGPVTEAYPDRYDPSRLKGLELDLSQKVKWEVVPGDWF